jgi:RNA polymerase sigma factor (sigma-70 family)
MRLRPESISVDADLSLARRCAVDLGAREECFRLHAPAVYRLARRLLGNSADAEDILQEVFIEVFHSIHNYRGEASLRSWLHRIAVRRVLRFSKHRTRRVQLELLIGGRESIPDGPARLFDSRATLRRVRELLDKLSDEKRIIFILHEVEGYSLPESAALLGISVTAAKKRVWRARRDLERLSRRDAALAGYFHEKDRDHD